MVSRVQKWGNSLGLRIPKSFAEELGIEASTRVDISVDRGRLVVRPRPEPAFALNELLTDVTKENLHDEADFGESLGREAF